MRDPDQGASSGKGIYLSFFSAELTEAISKTLPCRDLDLTRLDLPSGPRAGFLGQRDGV